MKLFVLLSLVAASRAAPQLSSFTNTSSEQSWEEWAEQSKEQILRHAWWQRLQDYLPVRVKEFVESTVDEGTQVVAGLSDEASEAVFNRTLDHVDEVTLVMENFISKLERLAGNAGKIGEDGWNVFEEEGKPKTDAEIAELKVQRNTSGTETRLEEFKEEVKGDRREDQQYEGLEGQLQRMISEARQVVVAWNAGSAVGFSMLKQLEVEMYEMNAALADTSGELKELMRKMFETLNEELKKASPALREIIDGVSLPRYNSDMFSWETIRNFLPRQF